MPSVSRRPGRQSAEHQAAVTRRLELLRAELSAAPVPHPADPPDDPPADPAGDPGATGWDEHEDDAWWSAATRIRGLAPVPDEAAPVSAASDPGVRWRSPAIPAAVPVAVPLPGTDDLAGARVATPGRHASRRHVHPWRGLVPETLRGRVAIGPAQLTVVVALLCLGLAALAFTAVRGRPQDLTPVAAPVALDPSGAPAVDPDSATAAQAVSLDAVTGGAAEPSGSAGIAPTDVAVPSAPSAGATGATGATTVTVDVAGKVRRPGIAVLDTGARVIDAIEAAGGARQGVDLTSLNLARPLVDGEQVLVGIDPPPGAAVAALTSPAPGAPTSTGGPGALVDLNTGTEADLDTLPDVGPVTAQSIIAWREEHGGFTTVDELLEVDGIGPATLEKLAPLVTV